MSNTEKIVVRVKPSHPTGSRNRAWFTFWQEPSFVEVTPEQKKLIQEDAYLLIIERWTALEQGLENPAKVLDDEDNAEGSEDQADETETDESEEDETASNVAWNEGFETSEESEDQAEAKPISRMNKDELVAALIAKGQVEGTDFNATSSNDSLRALLASL